MYEINTYIYIDLQAYVKSRHFREQKQFITPNNGQAAFHTATVLRDHKQAFKINNKLLYTVLK